MTKEQLEGLDDVLPAGYPKVGGLVVIRNSKRSGARRRRKRYDGTKRTPAARWYRMYVCI